MTALEARVIVIGAGAAGLWAAAVAARAESSVLVLEKTPRAGTKVLASGGTHCNLTTTLAAKPAADLFGRNGARFLATAFRVLPPSAVRERFAALGVPTVEAPLEKVFPVSGRARDVRDALERDARAAGAKILFDAAVQGLERASSGWIVTLADGLDARCERLIVCPGGKSYPRTGTTGDGYAWLARLGLEIVEPVPALVPLASSDAWVRELSGVALQDVEARIVDARGEILGKRRRPVLFTHHGVSGPGAMDLSEHIARREIGSGSSRDAGMMLQIDLFPDVSHEMLRARLVEAAGLEGAPSLARAMPLEVPRRVLAQCARQADLGESDPRPNRLSKDARHRLVLALKGLDVRVSGTLGYDAAEVTAGGLALTALDSGTMRVRGHDGLFVCGEILDLQGPIGGLNFQAAFATAELAARDAAR